ncbi:hypothetical protein AWC38_SpisGene8187 [Stylophora pistillata]|uniref:Uncharacterized protein n=1 Tax=Stylophora pistillata TaxID=50429 RepID=A0A2B4SDI0_STYPI|nr:hypothetical protein AWC38_SpisGene8187 [Stylophora pistillata]
MKPKEQKPIEFALLRSFDDEEMQDDGCSPNLKRDSILTSGMLMLTDEDSENVFRNKILESLKKKYPLMGMNDFEFVKVRHKAISTLQLGSGTEYSYAVVKKMAGQGLLYVKIKQGFKFIYDDALMDGKDLSDEISITAIVKSENLNDPLQGSSSSSPDATTKRAEMGKDKGDEFSTPPHCDEVVSALIQELAGIKDYTTTFEVEFIGEMAKDLGGPRKEWIRLVNCEIKKKYFDNVLRTYLSEDYYYVGIMVGIALLQNGAIPAFMPIEVLDQLLVFSNTDSCIANIQRGLEVFDLCTVIRSYPIMLHLLRPTTGKL